MGGHKNNVCTDKKDTDLDLDPLVGEISPNIIFGKKTHKKSKRGVDGSGWVHMGSHGCSGVYLRGGTGQQGWTRQKLVIRTFLQVWSRKTKTTRS